MAKRRKISGKLEAEVMFKSDRLCCVDQKRGDHIHHIDGDPSNNNLENLALLCFNCHDEASAKRGLRRRLSAESIRKFRAHHYEVITIRRAAEIKTFDQPLPSFSEEKLINAAKSAMLILEIAKLRFNYSKLSKWQDKHELLQDLFQYSEQWTNRAIYELAMFLLFVSYDTRRGMTSDVSCTIASLAEEVIHSVEENINEEQIEVVGNQLFHVGFNIAYDAFIYLNDFKVALWGLELMRYLYKHFKKINRFDISKEGEKNFSNLAETLKRPERNDLHLAQKFLQVYKNDLDNPGFEFPDLPDDLKKVLN